MVTAVAAWSIWGGDVFPAQQDPTGSKHTKVIITIGTKANLNRSRGLDCG